MFDTFFQAMLWTCKTCGYQIEGRQPMYECPLCESYKTNFIDIPQHLEAKVREAHEGKSFNHADARAIAIAEDVCESRRLARAEEARQQRDWRQRDWRVDRR